MSLVNVGYSKNCNEDCEFYKQNILTGACFEWFTVSYATPKKVEH